MSAVTSTQCLLCQGKLTPILSLGSTPLANELHVSHVSSVARDTFPLTLTQCDVCQHLQLDTLVNESRMYDHYLYVSNTGTANMDHFRWYAQDVMKRFGLVGETVLRGGPFTATRHSIVDIGSNDGLFLSFFKGKKWKVLGVDPSDVSARANAAGIPTFKAAWDEEWGQLVYGLCDSIDIITCNNCFAHTADLHTFLRGVKHALADNGTFIYEVSYALDMLEHNLFDLIYHEHIHYWTMTAARSFFESHGMRVIDVEQIPTHGGSIRVFVAPKHQKKEPTKAVTNMLQREREMLPKFVHDLPGRVEAVKKKLRALLRECVSPGATVSVLGYPAKACTISSYCGLSEFITDVYDDNGLKVGRYSHEGKPILHTDRIKEHKPDYLLILSWNYADQLIAKHKNFGGQFIVPLPEPRIA